MTSELIAGAELFRAVMVAAGGRGQCEGQCGQPHSKGGGRYLREHDHYASKRSGPVRLIVAPADSLTTEPAAASLPASELRAWCPTCHAAAQRITRRVARTERATAQGSLFDL